MDKFGVPMDVDSIDSDFDNKENTFHHSNVLPCTEKGYEELDVSELNMKLRYSMTPASSPMSKSYTASLDNKNHETDDMLNCSSENFNLTWSLNSTMTKNDSVIKTLKNLPLQLLSTDQYTDTSHSNSNLVLRELNSTITDSSNIQIRISEINDNDENLSLASSSSSVLHTPETMTPTKDITKDEGSPIIRGLKSVLNMFRSSQSPIPPTEDDIMLKQEILCAANVSMNQNDQPQAIASTPITAHRTRDSNTSKRSSPYKDSIVFNDDLEKELNWKDDTTILFNEEKIPVNKLFFQHAKGTLNKPAETDVQSSVAKNPNYSVEYMDVSFNESKTIDVIMTESQMEKTKQDINFTVESDSEFVDCETTFSKNESLVLGSNEIEKKNILLTNVQDLEVTTNILNAVDNTFLVSDVTGTSSNDVTEPSDYSDYSKETTEILLSLEKFEENVPSIGESSNTNINPQGNITFEENVIEQQAETHEMMTNIALDENYKTETLKYEEEPNTDTEHSGTKIKPVHIAETLTESNHEITKSKMIDIDIDDNSKISYEVPIDPTPQIIHEDHKILDTKLDVKNIESLSEVDTMSTNISEIVPSKFLNITQNDAVANSPETMLTNNPAEIPLPSTECQRMCEEIDFTKGLNESVPDTSNVLQSQKLDMPLLSKNATDTEITASIFPATLRTETVLATFPEKFDILNKLPESGITERINQNIDVDNEVINEDVLAKPPLETTLDVVPETINMTITLPRLDVTTTDTVLANVPGILNVTNTLPEIEMTETVYEDLDDKKEVKVSDTLIITSTTTMSAMVSETSNVPNTLPELDVSEKVDVSDAVVEDKFQNSCIESEIIDTASCKTTITENEFIIIKTLHEKPLEILSTSNPVNKAECVKSLEVCSDVPLESQKMMTTDLKLNVTDITNKNSTETSLQSEVSNNSNLPEGVSSISTFDQICEPVGHKITEIAAISQCAINQLNVAVETDNFEQQAHNQTIDEIKKDESFNQTLKLPDLVNQSAVVSEEVRNFMNTTVVPISDETKPDETGNKSDEEIIVSENNSPYVSLMTNVNTVSEKVDETFEKIDNSFDTKSNQPSSPPITSKGYNFNFDEMDDPFATKTKIRLSPPPNTFNEQLEMKNEKNEQFELPKKEIVSRRKSQPAKKKPAAIKKKFNTSFDASSAFRTSANRSDDTTQNVKHETISSTEISCEMRNVTETTTTEIAKPFDVAQIKQNENSHRSNEKTKLCGNFTKQRNIHKLGKSFETSEDETIDWTKSSDNALSSHVKTTSSFEQSTYYSAGASSTESIKSKNVFNLPEIDDVNFNPFATKSKMRQSPPPELEISNPFATRTKINSSLDTSAVILPPSDSNCIVTYHEDKTVQLAENIVVEDKMDMEVMEKDSSANISDTKTSSSKFTDNQNLTTHEINTEDEDTIEGPFLDQDDVTDKIKFETDNVDMIQFSHSPAQRAENNLEEGELFIDAEAFESLLNQNKSNVVLDSGKESLFLKFDPLFAKRISSDGVVATLNQVPNKQSTPTKLIQPLLRNEASPIAGPSTLNVTYENDNNVTQDSCEDVNITVSKPMMVVTPAINPDVTQRNKSITPTRSNRRSITFTSPAIAVIDRLLSMSGNSSLLGQDTNMLQANRDHTEADLALTQLRELLAEKEISVYNLRSESKELKDRLANMESQVRILEADGQDRLKKINELNQCLEEKTKTNKSMASVVEEYERTIAGLITGIEQDKKRNAEEKIRLINEIDEQKAHLASMEVSFNDIHSKYEKSKQVIISYKANEDTYKRSLKELEENVTKLHANYERLKQHANSKLNHANKELDKLKTAHEADILKLNAKLKRQELHVTSLEESLAQKIRANEELAAICDELINKVG